MNPTIYDWATLVYAVRVYFMLPQKLQKWMQWGSSEAKGVKKEREMEEKQG